MPIHDVTTEAMEQETMPQNLTTHEVFPTPNNDAFLEHGVYQALDPAQQEIRLIRLYVDDDDDAPIRCDLLPPVPLASVQGKYTAVSYCAGDPGTTKTVLVNGIPFTVFANLAHVLDVARDFWHKSFPPNSNSTTENECILWADQISINQFDLAERSHQVGFMRSIYASAARTLICISTTRAVDTHGVEWLAALHASVDPDGDFYHYYYALEYHLRTKLAAASAAVLKSDSESDSDDAEAADGGSGSGSGSRGGGRFAADWLALYDIFTSPWWTRTWVYQEFISSAEAHVLYGGASIAWRHVAEVLPTLRKYKVGTLGYQYRFPDDGGVRGGGRRLSAALDARGAEPEVRETMAAVVDFFIRSKLRFDRAGPYELMDLLARSRHLRSTDCRDRVYAFLGLVRCDYGIVPDYSPNNTMASLLADMASKIVCRDQQLDILSYACEARGPLSGRLPSWAPDWTCTSCREIRSRTIEEQTAEQTAGDVPAISVTNYASVGAGDNSSSRLALHVEGYYIGAVPDQWDLRVVFHDVEILNACGGKLRSEGDEFWALVGARNPVVLHWSRDDGAYRVIEEARFSVLTSLAGVARKYGLRSQTLVII